VAECKGGVINSKHSGQLSRLRKGLCEAVGLSLATETVEGRRQFAVVPKTATTAALAKKMAARARAAGIEIALVNGSAMSRTCRRVYSPFLIGAKRTDEIGACAISTASPRGRRSAASPARCAT
jgi:hypothetical protein